MASEARLHVGGLSENVDEAELSQHFSSHGTVKNVCMVTREGLPGTKLKVFAYVTLQNTPQAINNCIASLNKKKWNGSTLTVARAKESYVERIHRQQAKEEKAEKAKKAAAAAGMTSGWARTTNGCLVPNFQEPAKAKSSAARTTRRLFTDSDLEADVGYSSTVTSTPLQSDDPLTGERQQHHQQHHHQHHQYQQPASASAQGSRSSKRGRPDDSDPSRDSTAAAAVRSSQSSLASGGSSQRVKSGVKRHRQQDSSNKSSDSSSGSDGSDSESGNASWLTTSSRLQRARHNDDDDSDDNDSSWLFARNDADDAGSKAAGTDDSWLSLGVQRAHITPPLPTTTTTVSATGSGSHSGKTLASKPSAQSNSKSVRPKKKVADSSSDSSSTSSSDSSSSSSDSSNSSSSSNGSDSSSSRDSSDSSSSDSSSSSSSGSNDDDNPITKSKRLVKPEEITLSKTSTLSKKSQYVERDHVADNATRLAGLNARTEAISQESRLITESLRAVKSKSIIFSSDSSDEDKGEEEEEEDSDSGRFGIKPQFEGKAGAKLLRLQQRVGADERFKIDSRFAESESEDEEDNATNKDEIGKQLDEERARHLSLVSKMLGKRMHSRKPQMTNAEIMNIPSKRYDPNRPECAALELPARPATKKAPNISLDRFDNDEDSDGLPSRHSIAAAKADISPAPKVSSERYFKSSGKLKDLFSKTAATGSFSFSFPGGDDAAAATGVKGDDTRKSSDDTRHTGSTFNKGSDGNPVSTATGTQHQQRRRKPMWRPDAVRDTSDEESDEDVGADDNSRPIVNAPVEGEKFLFTMMNSEDALAQPHVKAALSRFRRTNTVEEIEEQWKENRHFLTQSYKQKHKDAMRQQRRQQHRSSDQAGGGGAGTRKRKHRA
ncbi:nucleolar protein 8-like [Sycon ciliatum]|uniref:nucleolar protein 8-like n=1 Tax=Sycon ciliatum TaxID=27933 RepID=UPI0031F6CB01